MVLYSTLGAVRDTLYAPLQQVVQTLTGNSSGGGVTTVTAGTAAATPAEVCSVCVCSLHVVVHMWGVHVCGVYMWGVHAM